MTVSEQARAWTDEANAQRPEPCGGRHVPVAHWDGYQWLYADYCKYCDMEIR